MNDYLAIGNDELREEIKEGQTIYNEELNRRGMVKFATDDKGNKTNLLLFITHNEIEYIVGVSGRLVQDWKVVR